MINGFDIFNNCCQTRVIMNKVKIQRDRAVRKEGEGGRDETG